jgi:hypothetical protein
LGKTSSELGKHRGFELNNKNKSDKKTKKKEENCNNTKTCPGQVSSAVTVITLMGR